MSKTKEVNEKQLEATDLVYRLRDHEKVSNDNVLAEIVGIAKVTLYTRLKRSNWKINELSHIDKLKKTYKL